MAFDFRYPTPLPSTKGWGPGWPDCQPAARAGESDIFFPGVHARIAELVSLITAEMERRGFHFMKLQQGCWGYGCRATKDSAGTQDDIPSFHSWGLALDINAPLNPFGADRDRTQLGQPDHAWVITLMRRYGFFWLGPAIRDWMHFSFCGSPQDADRMTELAREELTDMSFEEFRAGWKAHRAGIVNNPDWPDDKNFGWSARNEAVENPRPEAHEHVTYAPKGHGHGDTYSRSPHVHGEDIEVN